MDSTCGCMAEASWLSLWKTGSWNNAHIKMLGEWRTKWNNARKCSALSAGSSHKDFGGAALGCCSLRKTTLSCSCFSDASASFWTLLQWWRRLHTVSLRTNLARILQTLMKWRNHWTNRHYVGNFHFYFKLYFLTLRSYHEKDKYSRKTNPNGRNHYMLEGLIFKKRN